MIAIAVIVVTVIGILCAVLLSVASKVMAVEVDERIPRVRECLPGANCGGCGFAGCDGYAAALVEDPDTPLTLCSPGGAAAAQALSSVLGREAGEVVQKAAFVLCRGDCNATSKKMDYRGIESCAAAKLLYGGTGKCSYGCLGLGDCAAVCSNNGICIENGIAHVDTRACLACGECVAVCPNGLISILPVAAPVKVLCSSKDKGAVVRKQCTAGCIGCGLCMKNCPTGAITVSNNLASIDYTKCTGCGTCQSKCPVKCIL